MFNIGFNGSGPAEVQMGASRERLGRTILDAAGSYERQTGRIGEALDAPLARVERPDRADAFTELETRAVEDVVRSSTW